MKVFINRFLAVFLSLFLIIAPTIQQANAASSWNITSAVNAGSRTIVTATKGGYKSAVNIAPSAGRLALKLGKGANWAALLYAAVQLLPDIKDIDSFKANPSTNSVDYKKNIPIVYRVQAAAVSDTAVGACKNYVSITANVDYAFVGATYSAGSSKHFDCYIKDPRYPTNSAKAVQGSVRDSTDPAATGSIAISRLSPQVIKNAVAGHQPSLEAVKATAVEMVVAGDFDKDLLAGAVPISDNRPLIPSVPGNQNGNVTPGTDPGLEGATPGTQADAAKAAADAAKAAADAAADAAKDAQNQAANDAADAQDLINSAADQAAIDAANARAKAAEQAAADSKAVSDRAAQAAADAAKAADRAAAQAAAQAAADAKAAQAAAQAAIDAVKSAAEADKAAAQAAADAAVRAADAAKAQAEARAKAAEEAAKAAEKAKAEAAKPFELPAFCTWAAIVCETAKWLKEEPASMTPTTVDTDSPIDDFDSDKSYITFTGSCPPKYTASLSIMGATAPFEFDYTPICTVMSYLKPFIVGAGYIAAAYIIAGHSRGSKD